MPEISFNRPKMGFGNPIGLFLNNELKEWSINLINNDNDFIEDIINMDQIHKIWELHQNKKKDYSNVIWNFLILKNWLKHNESINLIFKFILDYFLAFFFLYYFFYH